MRDPKTDLVGAMELTGLAIKALEADEWYACASLTRQALALSQRLRKRHHSKILDDAIELLTEVLLICEAHMQ